MKMLSLLGHSMRMVVIAVGDALAKAHFYSASGMTFGRRGVELVTEALKMRNLQIGAKILNDPKSWLSALNLDLNEVKKAALASGSDWVPILVGEEKKRAALAQMLKHINAVREKQQKSENAALLAKESQRNSATLFRLRAPTMSAKQRDFWMVQVPGSAKLKAHVTDDGDLMVGDKAYNSLFESALDNAKIIKT